MEQIMQKVNYTEREITKIKDFKWCSSELGAGTDHI